MPSDLMELALGEFRVAVERFEVQVESRSGASVQAVRTIDAEAAYLKVTPVALGPEALAAARRELRFYQDLAPVAPIRTPRLLNSLDTEEGVAMLLTAAGTPQGVASWTRDMWTNLGRDLAALHSMPLPKAGDSSRPDALLEALAAPNLKEINDFWAATLPQLPALVSGRTELHDQISALPPVLIHGDCHTDNIVHAAGSLVFCDWQAVGVGRPASDLAFLSVRATPSGTAVPRALVDAYLDVRPCDRRALERALVAEELAIFVFLWPPYAAFNSPSGNDRVRRRARELAGRYLG
ncbi:phosphotransferase family protein [Streptomyces jeddahensis]|uniref:Phosphotransferase enzyme family protein n=1 Tax=Streptomyces jeddahensis TaxID=1716141 RepID=A0A177HP93_9ACTN|nr:aminoglycoside phosphotransferase family protein [Streptomyces jeddahensis]OAH12440.1 phosphotransferase enzyme family protein [Streptomyces jeddahensis]